MAGQDKNVQLPDGRVVVFPASMSDDDITAVLREDMKLQQPAQEDPSIARGAVLGIAEGLGIPETSTPVRDLGRGLLHVGGLVAKSAVPFLGTKAAAELFEGLFGHPRREAISIAKREMTQNPRAGILRVLSEVPLVGPPAVKALGDVAEGYRSKDFEQAARGVTSGLTQVATLGLGLGLLRKGAQTGAQRGLQIAGKPFPATKGMISPLTKTATLESLLEDVPLIGKPIKRMKTKIVPQAARQAISDIAVREARKSGAPAARIGRGAANFIEDVRGAGNSFRRQAGRLYKTIERELEPLELKDTFIQLQSERQRIQNVRNSGRQITAEEHVALEKALSRVEDDIPALFEIADRPELLDMFSDANSLVGRGYAVNEFEQKLSKATKGLQESSTPRGVKSRPQEINSRAFLSSVRKMSQTPVGKTGATRLEQAFGKEGAKEIVSVAEMLDRAHLDKSFPARLRQMGAGTMYGGIAGFGAYVSPLAAGAAGTAAYLIARNLANKAGRGLLRKFLTIGPSSPRAAVLIGRLHANARDSEKEGRR